VNDRRTGVAGRCELALGDRLTLALAEHGALPCERAARVVAARTVDVRHELRRDPRFEHTGAGRGSRWTLALGLCDGKGRIPSAPARSDVGATVTERLDVLERRVAELERATREAPER
jgi:hypothetical protein